MRKILAGLFVVATSLTSPCHAATDSDIDKLTSYAVVLGRSVACGLSIKEPMSRVGKWMDVHFPPGSDDQKIYLPIFLEGIKYHAQQQKSGKSPDSCIKVGQAFDGFPWPNEAPLNSQSGAMNSQKSNINDRNEARPEAANCSKPQTQTDLNICSQQEYQAEEVKINEIYRQYRSQLDSADKQKIKDVQLAWIKYRDLACKFESSATEGGSMQPWITSQCMIEHTITRRKQLEKMMSCSHRVVPGCK